MIAFKNTVTSFAESYRVTIWQPSIMGFPSAGGGKASISRKTDDLAASNPLYMRNKEFSARKMRFPSSNQRSSTRSLAGVSEVDIWLVFYGPGNPSMSRKGRGVVDEGRKIKEHADSTRQQSRLIQKIPISIFYLIGAGAVGKVSALLE